MSELAESTGMHSQFFALVGTYYGIGILSKTEPISVKTKSFAPSDTSKDKESRGFLIAEFDNFYFLCTHYSLNADDRDTATEWAIRFARQSDKTVFIAGDFNAAYLSGNGDFQRVWIFDTEQYGFIYLSG